MRAALMVGACCWWLVLAVVLLLLWPVLGAGNYVSDCIMYVCIYEYAYWLFPHLPAGCFNIRSRPFLLSKLMG